MYTKCDSTKSIYQTFNYNDMDLAQQSQITEAAKMSFIKQGFRRMKKYSFSHIKTAEK